MSRRVLLSLPLLLQVVSKLSKEDQLHLSASTADNWQQLQSCVPGMVPGVEPGGASPVRIEG